MRRQQPWRTNRARVLRAASTPAENRLWAELRDRQLAGHKFVRQRPIGSFVPDFLCRSRKVVVEIDGGTHSTDDEIARDRARTSRLEAMGYQVLRVHNCEVMDDIDGVLGTILDFVEQV